MADFLFHAHSGLRYLVLLAGVLSLGYTIAGLVTRKPWDKLGRIFMAAFVGTLTVGAVAAVYLFLQGAGSDLRRPVVIPFRAWSYFYPLGMVTGAFSGPLTGLSPMLSLSVSTVGLGFFFLGDGLLPPSAAATSLT